MNIDSHPYDRREHLTVCGKCGMKEEAHGSKEDWTTEFARFRDYVFLEINRAGTAAMRGELNPEENLKRIMDEFSTLLQSEREKAVMSRIEGEELAYERGRKEK